MARNVLSSVSSISISPLPPHLRLPPKSPINSIRISAVQPLTTSAVSSRTFLLHIYLFSSDLTRVCRRRCGSMWRCWRLRRRRGRFRRRKSSPPSQRSRRTLRTRSIWALLAGTSRLDGLGCSCSPLRFKCWFYHFSFPIIWSEPIWFSGKKFGQRELHSDHRNPKIRCCGEYLSIIRPWSIHDQFLTVVVLAQGRRIENGVYFGGLGNLSFEGRLSWKKKILAFVFERVRIKAGPFGPFEINLGQTDPNREPSNKDPFFIWFYVDEEIAVAQGKSGGTAFWCRCARVV